MRPVTPFLWMVFGAGGTIAARLYPIHFFLIAVAFPLGWLPAPSHEALRALVQHPLVRLYLFVLIGLPLFHSAPRFPYTLYDGLMLKHLYNFIAVICYGIALWGPAVPAYPLGTLP